MGPPVQGAPRDAKKIWTAHGSGPGIYLPPFWGGKQKKKGRHPQSFAYTPPSINPGKYPGQGHRDPLAWAPQCLNPGLGLCSFKSDWTMALS
jgi:hypothetical protein